MSDELAKSAATVREFASIPMGDYDDITVFGTDDQTTVTYGDLRALLNAFTREDLATIKQLALDARHLSRDQFNALDSLASRISALLPPETPNAR